MSSSTPDTTTAKVREEVARAREILRARAERAGRGDPASDEFLRRYLRILSLQAVGQFSEAMASTAEGVTALTASHAAHGERLVALEQDLLALVQDLGHRDWPSGRLDELSARISRLEAGAGHRAGIAAADVYDRIAARLAAVIGDDGRGSSGREIGCAPDPWYAAAARIAAVRLARTTTAELASVPTGAVPVVSALFLFDASSEPEATRVAVDAHRALGVGGVLFAVVEPLQPAVAIVRPHGQRPVAAPGILADILTAAGFRRVVDVPLDDGAVGPRVITAHRH
jgi:hypothetical protein